MPLANLLWPSLLLQNSTATTISIVVALAVEGFFLWRVTQFPFLKVVLATLSMNILSTLIGFAGTTVMEGWIAAATDSTLPYLLTWGGFNGPFWITSLVLFALVDSALEGTFVRLVFKIPIPIGGFLLIAISNMIGLASGVMLHLVVAMARGV